MSNTENRYTETDLGNVAPNPRGEYDPAEAYEYLDLVEYGGGSYLCVQEAGTVTVRDRDTMEQKRVAIADLKQYLEDMQQF